MTATIGTDLWMLTDVQLTARVVEAFGEKARAEARCACLMAAVQDREVVRLAGASHPERLHKKTRSPAL